MRAVRPLRQTEDGRGMKAKQSNAQCQFTQPRRRRQAAGATLSPRLPRSRRTLPTCLPKEDAPLRSPDQAWHGPAQPHRARTPPRLWQYKYIFGCIRPPAQRRISARAQIGVCDLNSPLSTVTRPSKPHLRHTHSPLPLYDAAAPQMAPHSTATAHHTCY